MKTLSFFCFLLSFTAFSQRIVDSTIVASHLSIPWDMQQAGKKHLIFSELGGKIYRLNLKTGKRQLIYEAKDIAREVQSGLMGLAVHPSKKYVYAMYAFYDSSFNMYSRVVRFKNKKKTRQFPNSS